MVRWAFHPLVEGSQNDNFAKSIQPEVLEALATIAGGEKTAPLDD